MSHTASDLLNIVGSTTNTPAFSPLQLPRASDRILTKEEIAEAAKAMGSSPAIAAALDSFNSSPTRYHLNPSTSSYFSSTPSRIICEPDSSGPSASAPPSSSDLPPHLCTSALNSESSDPIPPDPILKRALTTSPEYRALDPLDQHLINLYIESNCNLQKLISRVDDHHPAQRSFITLTDWLDQPHIDAMIERALTSMRKHDQRADELRNRFARDGLVESVHRAGINIRRLEESPAESRQHTRAIEEFRLANQALHRATKPPAPPKTPRLTKQQKLNQELEAKPTPKPKQPNPRDIPINYAEVIAKYAAQDAAAAAAQKAANDAAQSAAHSVQPAMSSCGSEPPCAASALQPPELSSQSLV